MGYELAYFVRDSDIDQEFVCAICSMVLENPVVTPCEHIFCSKCIQGWIAVEANCPVDRQTIRLVDLKPAPKYFCSLLDKLEVRCEFESFGCKSIIPLGRLRDHIADCMYRPDAVVVCDKGCNITMTRREYQQNCHTHLTNKFNGQYEQLTKLIEELLCLQQDINLSSSPTNYKLPMWKASHNMSISSDWPYVLEPIGSTRFCWAFAQFANRLTRENCYFKVRISSIDHDGYVVIGLTQYGHQDELPGCRIGSIGYHNKGEVVCDGIAQFGLQKLKAGDIIECGIMYAHDKLVSTGEVFFFINQKRIVKKVMELPAEGYFPTIRMGSFSSAVPKVEYFPNYSQFFDNM